MPETKRPLKVFLCHAHIIPLRDSDAAAVRALYNRLVKDGVDIILEEYAWLDKEKLFPG